MREKYIEERYPRAMIFGRFPDGDVDVTTVNDNFSFKLPPDKAEELVAEYNKLHDLMTRMALAFDEANHDAFSEFWYGKSLTTNSDG